MFEEQKAHHCGCGGRFLFFKMSSLMGLNHYRGDARTSVEHREALEKEREDRIKRTSRRI